MILQDTITLKYYKETFTVKVPKGIMPYVKEIQAFLTTQGLNVSLGQAASAAVVNTHNVKDIIQAELPNIKLVNYSLELNATAFHKLKQIELKHNITPHTALTNIIYYYYVFSIVPIMNNSKTKWIIQNAELRTALPTYKADKYAKAKIDDLKLTTNITKTTYGLQRKTERRNNGKSTKYLNQNNS